MSLRLNIILAFVFFLIILLTVRVYFLQVINGLELSQRSVMQKTEYTKLEVNRATIFDRNMIPLVNRSLSEKVIINLKKSNLNMQQMHELSLLLNIPIDAIQSKITNDEAIICNLTPDIKNFTKHLNGVSTVRYVSRYDDSTVARHVIGYIGQSDNIGKSGIEKAYDSMISGGDSIKVAVIKDATNRPIPGIGYRIVNDDNVGEKYDIKLTIDYYIQKAVEDALENALISTGLSSAAVVLDVKNGDIVAMASKPDFDQNNIANYIYGSQSELMNKAITNYNIGSIFKIIVTAACLENKLIEDGEYYNCNGGIDVDGRFYKCSAHQNNSYESLTLQQAFACSCNTVFIKLGLRAGHKSIIEMAKHFGLGEQLKLSEHGIEANKSVLPDTSYSSNRQTANISIGQGDILISPLQVADIAAIIANDGIKNDLNIIDSIINKNNVEIKNTNQQKSKRVISSYTAFRIRRMMEEAVNNGTGTNAISKLCTTAGKTGTAETGWKINGKNALHAWFVGYFPVNYPKYAVAVLIVDGQSGGTNAAPIFKNICEEVTKLNR